MQRSCNANYKLEFGFLQWLSSYVEELDVALKQARGDDHAARMPAHKHHRLRFTHGSLLHLATASMNSQRAIIATNCQS